MNLPSRAREQAVFSDFRRSWSGVSWWDSKIEPLRSDFFPRKSNVSSLPSLPPLPVFEKAGVLTAAEIRKDRLLTTWAVQSIPRCRTARVKNQYAGQPLIME